MEVKLESNVGMGMGMKPITNNRNGDKNEVVSSNPIKKMRMYIPIGFRFRPTDEEVVVHYLKPKSMCLPLPASSIIPDFLNVFRSDPWSLPGDWREKKYYFGRRKLEASIGKSSGRIMATTSGFWKAVGKQPKQIASSSGDHHENDVVGCRKSWAFYQLNKQPIASCYRKNTSNSHMHALGLWSKTRWFMHEFQLLHYSTYQDQTDETQENWVVCRIFQRKIRPKNHRHHLMRRDRIIGNNDMPNIIDLRTENIFDLGPPEPSSPSQAESTSSSSC